MTVSSTTNRKTFAGNGVTTSFATSPVVFFDTSDLVLTAVTDSTGASEALVENTDYTVTGGAGSTGTVSLAGGSSPYGAPAAGVTLVIRRVLPLTQDDDFLNNDINDAEVLEDRLDRLTMIAQQLDEGNDLGVRLSSDETATDALTVLPFDRASKYLGFDASKELVALAAPTSTALTTAYSETLLAAANAAAARTVLGVDTLDAANVKLTGDQTVAGVKTFSSTPVLPAIGNGLVPTGTVLDFAGTAAPTGFLGCDGAAVSRATYAALFTAISTTWGVGDGATTFNLPNFQRRVAVGSGGSGTATLANTVGSTGGAETHTLVTAEMPAHTHDVTAFASGGSYAAASNIAGSQTITSTSTGGGGAHNNMQPSAVVLKIIKT